MYRECRASPEAEHTVWWILVARAVERAVIERMQRAAGEPVAWGVRDLDPKCECWLHIAETRDMAYDHIKDAAVDPQLAVMSRTWVVRPLYAAPQPAAPMPCANERDWKAEFAAAQAECANLSSKLAATEAQAAALRAARRGLPASMVDELEESMRRLREIAQKYGLNNEDTK